MQDKNEIEKIEENEIKEIREIRHTISAEETFTLAKDVFDIRCFIKSVYSNRAQIARRLNIVGLVFSLAFTLFYSAFLLFGGIYKKLTLGWEIVVYSVLGVYAVLVITLFAVTIAFNRRATTENAKLHTKILKIFRYIIRIASLAMSICALALSVAADTADSVGVALDTIAIIFSIISVIVALVPLLCGGVGGLVRWLLSPAKIKRRFSLVVFEWYNSIVSGSPATNFTKKVSPEYIADISRCIDNYLVPALGKKYASAIGTNQIFAVINSAPEEDRSVLEGTIKNVFGYALECGYVTSDPCRDLQLTGSIEIVEKPKKEPLKVRLGKKIGKKIVKQFFGDEEEL